MGAGTNAITIDRTSATVKFGSNKYQGLDLVARTSNLSKIIISRKGSSLPNGIVYEVASTDLASHTIDGNTYVAVVAWIHAFNTAIDEADSVNYNTKYPDTFFGEKVVVGVTAVKVKDVAKPGYITIKSATDNADEITIGGSGVTDGVGYVLQPDEEITVEHDSLNEIYAISGTATQEVHVIGSYKA